MGALSNLVSQQNWSIMLAVALTCLALGLVFTNLMNRARMNSGRPRLMIVLFSSIATGCALWVVHHLASLAYQPGIPIGYDKSLTMAAFLFATVLSGGAFAAVIYRPHSPVLGGVFLGLASVGTACIAFSAIQMPVQTSWHYGLLTFSAVLAVSSAAGALMISTHRPHGHSLLLSSFLLGSGIFVQHVFLAGAFQMEAGPAEAGAADLVLPGSMAILVAAVGAALSIGICAVFSIAGLDSSRLQSALDNLGVGLLIFDADERILVCNKPYQEMYNVAPEVVRPGTGTLGSLLKFRTENGTFREDPGQYLINLRAALHEGSSTHREPKLVDGRIVSVSTHPMIGGGWVAVHENISARRNAEDERAAMTAREQRRVWLEESVSSFRARVDAVLKTVAESTSAMKTTGMTLLASSGRTSQSTEAALTSSHEASAGAAAVAVATTELTASITEINRQLKRTTDVVQAAVTRADKTNMEIADLSEAAQKIGDVVKLIQGIAGQTNLLALNATIEAARAGDAGRGFAVVASEVKSLAIQTGKATEDIARQIAAVQSSSANAVDALRGITQQMQQINLFSSEAANSMARQDAATAEISRSVIDVAQGATNVTSVLSTVASDVANTSNAATTVQEVSGSVEMAAKCLLEEINAFLEKAAA